MDSKQLYQDMESNKNETGLGNYNTYIGARYVPIFDGQWNPEKPYEPLVIVQYQGNSYTSRTFVPIGMLPTNETYWALTGNYNAQIEAYHQEVILLENKIQEYQNLLKRNVIILMDDNAFIDDVQQRLEGVKRFNSVKVFANWGAGLFAKKYGQNFGDLLTSILPDIEEKNSITDVVICGGTNDIGYTGNDMQSIVNALTFTIQSNFPNAKTQYIYTALDNAGNRNPYEQWWYYTNNTVRKLNGQIPVVFGNPGSRMNGFINNTEGYVFSYSLLNIILDNSYQGFCAFRIQLNNGSYGEFISHGLICEYTQGEFITTNVNHEITAGWNIVNVGTMNVSIGKYGLYNHNIAGTVTGTIKLQSQSSPFSFSSYMYVDDGNLFIKFSSGQFPLATPGELITEVFIDEFTFSFNSYAI